MSNVASKTSNKIKHAKLVREKMDKLPVRDSSDSKINAYFKGFEEGVKFAQRIEMDAYKINIKKVANSVLSVIDYLRKISFEVEKFHLKVLGYNNFELLFTIPEKIYLKDEFKEIYSVVYNKAEELLEEDDLRLEIEFLPLDGEISEDVLESHGFNYTIDTKF